MASSNQPRDVKSRPTRPAYAVVPSVTSLLRKHRSENDNLESPRRAEIEKGEVEQGVVPGYIGERLDVVPATYRVLVTRRPRYGCRACEAAPVQAPAPARIVEGGLPTEALIAHVLVAKYADHLPLYRQAQIYARQGVTLDRSTLADWVGRAAWWLTPLRDHLFADLKRSTAQLLSRLLAPAVSRSIASLMRAQLLSSRWLPSIIAPSAQSAGPPRSRLGLSSRTLRRSAAASRRSSASVGGWKKIEHVLHVKSLASRASSPISKCTRTIATFFNFSAPQRSSGALSSIKISFAALSSSRRSTSHDPADAAAGRGTLFGQSFISAVACSVTSRASSVAGNSWPITASRLAKLRIKGWMATISAAPAVVSELRLK